MASIGGKDRDVILVPSSCSNEGSERDVEFLEKSVRKTTVGAVSKQRVSDGLTSSGSMRKVLLGHGPVHQEFSKCYQGSGDLEKGFDLFVTCFLCLIIILVPLSE